MRSGEATREGDGPEDGSGPIIVWVGRYDTNDGYGVAARSHVAALREAGAEVVSVDIESRKVIGPVSDPAVQVKRTDTQLEIRPRDPDRPLAVVVHDRPDKFNRIRARGRSRLMGFSYWETEDLPPDWVSSILSMDRILAASDFNAEAFRGAGVPAWMIDIVGQPLDRLQLEVSVSRGLVRSRWPAMTVLLSLASSMNQRRDLKALLEAFFMAFAADDDVCLVLKAPPGTDQQMLDVVDQVKRLSPARAAASWPAVHVVAEDLTREQLLRLHASVDCYVSCERGDGWDLPAMDSMSMGVPVISTAFGGSTSFLEPDDCFIIPTTDVRVASEGMLAGGHALYSGQRWPYLDPVAMADVMRVVHEEPDRREEAGRLGAERIRSRFEPEAVGALVRSVVESADPIDLRSGAPASVVVGKKKRGWGAAAHTELMNAPTILEARFLSLLGRSPGSSPSRAHAGRRWMDAFRLARERRSELRTTATGQLIGSVFRDARQSPLRGARTALRAATKFGTLGDRFAALGGPAGVVAVAEEYESAVAGARVRRDHVLVEEDRRALWSLAGPFRSPATELERFGALRNRHLGERIFIMGNGPSLVRCDLSRLRSEYTFGVNKIHLLFDQIEWRPSYYTLLDWKMGAAIAPHVDEFEGSTKFFPERFRGILPASDDTYWYWPRPVGRHIDDQFEPDLTRGIPSRATVLVTAIQQAFFLGFREIVLIGVDASYTIPATVRQSGPDQFRTGVRLHLESTRDDDPNHFVPSYFGEGSRWHDPNVDDMQRMLRLMRKGVERFGGRLINATVGGELKVLERVDFDDLFR